MEITYAGRQIANKLLSSNTEPLTSPLWNSISSMLMAATTVRSFRVPKGIQHILTGRPMVNGWSWTQAHREPGEFTLSVQMALICIGLSEFSLLYALLTLHSA